jgi:hypothetical protein
MIIAALKHSPLQKSVGLRGRRAWPETATYTWQHTRQTSIPRVGLEPAVPTSERPQTYAYVRPYTGTGLLAIVHYIFIHLIIRIRVRSTAGRYGVVGTASCYGLEYPVFELRWGKNISSCQFRPWVPQDFNYRGHWGFFLGVKQPGRRIIHQFPSNSETEIALCCSLAPLVCMLTRRRLALTVKCYWCRVRVITVACTCNSVIELTCLFGVVVLCLVTWCVAINNILQTAPQLNISQKALGTLPEDGNVTPKRVGATIHN